MRMNLSTFCVEATALGCLLLAGSTVSSGDETFWLASAEASIPNMTCKPLPAKQELTPPEQWNDCVGAFTFQNGNSYRGEFRHGMRTGIGVLMINYIGPSDYSDIGSDEPAIYIGNFSDKRLNGYGLLIRRSGVAYAGTFKDNIAQPDLIQKKCGGELSADWTNCIGTYRFSNGNVYRGEFAHGRPDGIGMLQVEATGDSDATQVRLPMPGVYVGQFKDGKLSGQGAVVIPDAGYFGTFSDNMFKPDKSESSDSRVR
jgi:hypothetical protein